MTTEHYTILRKLLLVFVALTLLGLPVIQAAHAFAHSNADSSSQINHDQGGNTLDKNCGDCLILSTVTTLFYILIILFFCSPVRLRLAHPKICRRIHQNPSYRHSPRAPPLA